MAASSSVTGHGLVFVALVLLSSTAYGQLSQTFYSQTCPSLDQIIKTEVSSALTAEKRMGASILRLFFHDCFVQGCDGSVLLDNVPNSERDASPNANSLRGFDVIDQIKAKVEASCSGVVSCADILALATREAVVELGGPSWTLLLGRRDSLTANKMQAESDLPGPGSNLDGLKAAFGKKGFTADDLLALSGGHTIGKAQCKFAEQFRTECLDLSSGVMTASLDLQTPEAFDTKYYDNLIKKQGLLHSDNELMRDATLKSRIKEYSSGTRSFNADFAAAMKKLSELGVLTGGQGQIRTDCKKVN